MGTTWAPEEASCRDGCIGVDVLRTWRVQVRASVHRHNTCRLMSLITAIVSSTHVGSKVLSHSDGTPPGILTRNASLPPFVHGAGVEAAEGGLGSILSSLVIS